MNESASSFRLGPSMLSRSTRALGASRQWDGLPYSRAERLTLLLTFTLSIVILGIGQSTAAESALLGQIGFLLPVIPLGILLALRGMYRPHLLLKKVVWPIAALLFIALNVAIYHQAPALAAPLALYPVLVLLVLLNGIGRSPEQMFPTIVSVYCLSFLTIICLSLFDAPFKLYRYTGIFSNPNQMGRFAAATIIAILPCLFLPMRSLGRLRIVFVSVTVAVALVMILASNHRTSLLTVSLVLTLLVIFSVFCGRSHVARVAFGAMSIFILAAGAAYFSGLFDQILSKALETYARGDFSQGRFDRWAVVLEEWSLLGHGYEYAETDVGAAHNLFFVYLGRFGIFAAVCFYLPFLLGVFRVSYLIIGFGRRLSNEQTLSAFFSLSAMMGFLVLNFFEGSTATSLTTLVVLAFGFWAGLERQLVAQLATRTTSRRWAMVK